MELFIIRNEAFDFAVIVFEETRLEAGFLRF